MRVLYINNDYAAPTSEEHAAEAIPASLVSRGHEVFCEKEEYGFQESAGFAWKIIITVVDCGAVVDFCRNHLCNLRVEALLAMLNKEPFLAESSPRE